MHTMIGGVLVLLGGLASSPSIAAPSTDAPEVENTPPMIGLPPVQPPPRTGWEAEPAPGWSLLVRPQASRPQEPSLYPDARAIRYRYAGERWVASAGARMFMFGYDSDAIGAQATWAGFIELHNLRQRVPVPWELFRAHVGFQLHLYSRDLEQRLPGRQRVDVMLGWFHESDHASATDSLFDRMTIVSTDPQATEALLNANMSSFEFWETRIAWQLSTKEDRLRFMVAPLSRLYVRPLSWVWSQRRMRGALAIEGRVSARASARVRPFLGGVVEATTYKEGPLDVVFDNGFSDQTRRHASVDLGVDLWSADGLVFSPHISVEWVHGRGIDWFLDYGRRFSFGVRVTP